MSTRKGNVPNAWDDDWESLADKQDTSPPEPAPLKKITKAERRAQHMEFNRQIWEQAETPSDTPLFLQARGEVPLKTDFKPAVKVLSRKPPPTVLSRNPSTGAASKVEDDGENSEEEARKKNEQQFAERQARAAREREEKQRKYAEVRERLFGSPAPTPEGSQERSSSPRNRNFRGKGRGRGGGGGDSSGGNSSADHSPARGPNSKKQLYDPGYSVKPRQEIGSPRSKSQTPGTDQPIRAPRGPDGTGRGGFGFATRGGRGGHAS